MYKFETQVDTLLYTVKSIKITSFRLNTVKIIPAWKINLQSNGIKECSILLQYDFSSVSISHRENMAVAPCDFKRKDVSSVYFKGQRLAKKVPNGWSCLFFL